VSSLDAAALAGRWFPICNREDLPARHIVETQLLGQELAVWRSDSGNVNVWANRCPHRGLRLTVGANLGRELRCAYHGYRFAEGSGSCTQVPAQPDRTPPRSLCAKTYAMREAGSLIWTRLADDPAAADPPLPSAGPALALYGVAIRASVQAIGTLLAQYRCRPSLALGIPESALERCASTRIDDYSFRSVATGEGSATDLRWFLQPIDAECTVVHGVLLEEVPAALRIATLRHHADALTALRESCEQIASSSKRGAPSNAHEVAP
jgi:nitrite reductase/ring-hydroxylating ferredoxin subunit